MIKSKINPDQVNSLTWVQYTKFFKKDIQLVESKSLAKVPLVMISDFTFTCGETHALVLLGKQSVLNKYYKSLKLDKDRKKLKDFSIGFCHFEKNENGTSSIKISLSGFGKPARMKRNSKKLFKKVGVSVEDIIKGEYLDETVNQTTDNPDEALTKAVNEKKEEGTVESDTQKLKTIAATFNQARKALNEEVVTLIKLSKSETVAFTSNHVKIAEEAFKTAASLVDTYNEVASTNKNLAETATKITALKDNVVKNNLVKKYEQVWKKVNLDYEKQLEQIPEPIKVKFDELEALFETIRQETKA